MDGKKAILVVSFGTSYLDTLEKTIGAIERRIAGAYPDYKVYRAFTSQMIINKLKRTENLQVDTVGEALKRMAAEGIERVIVQPTHVINGIENDRMMEDLMEYMDKFRKISVGKPMLSSVDDYKKAIHAVMAQTELKEEEMLPSVRTLAKELKISALTVKKAYDFLEEEGFVVTVHGKGSFIAKNNQGLLMEERKREIETELEEVIRKARVSGLSEEEIRELFELIMEE